ncbi:MAG: methylenetetrahydrofolate reductase [NAD(P)H] [Planctomycetales bacterium]|nr:methylenetetrahydrofolate reductase [NAD(P)H] [Planctomycetales bacterium]
MKLADLFQTKEFVLSFELFPPKSDSGLDELLQNVAQLNALQPDFFTCTYGAGGSTRDRTLRVATTVRQNHQVPVASHLTCVGATVDQLREYLREAAEQGIDYIVALRGDPPQGESQFRPVAGGLRYANELVTLIRDEFPQFGVAVAGYPETHQEAISAEVDLENLVRKVQAGADVVVTQLFYDNQDFFKFKDRCLAAGIHVPVIPGLLPVLNLKQVQKIATLCRAKLPQAFVERLQQHDDPEWQFQVGVEHATAQAEGLINAGVPGIHFYVLNRAAATQQILANVLP